MQTSPAQTNGQNNSQAATERLLERLFTPEMRRRSGSIRARAPAFGQGESIRCSLLGENRGRTLRLSREGGVYLARWMAADGRVLSEFPFPELTRSAVIFAGSMLDQFEGVVRGRDLLDAVVRVSYLRQGPDAGFWRVTYCAPDETGRVSVLAESELASCELGISG